MENPARKSSRKIGPEIEGTVPFDAACEIYAGKLLPHREFDVRIGFVIAKQDIEFRFVLLDEVVFKSQGFAGVGDYDGFEIDDFTDKRAGFGINSPTGFQEIGADAAAERDRFTDIDNLVPGVLEQIDTRGFRKKGGFFARFHAVVQIL